jgi:hypothetical protein
MYASARFARAKKRIKLGMEIIERNAIMAMTIISSMSV